MKFTVLAAAVSIAAFSPAPSFSRILPISFDNDDSTQTIRSELIQRQSEAKISKEVDQKNLFGRFISAKPIATDICPVTE